MKLIIGLGNPGKKYLKNRHNVGHMLVDQINSIKSIKSIKSDSFMNNSGDFVKKMTRTYNLEPSDLFVAHDDLDIPLGQYKIQFGVGPKVHNGVNSVEQVLGSSDFWRIRIGVDARDPLNRIPGDQYVLEDFSKAELEKLEEVFNAIVKDNSFPG